MTIGYLAWYIDTINSHKTLQCHTTLFAYTAARSSQPETFRRGTDPLESQFISTNTVPGLRLMPQHRADSLLSSHTVVGQGVSKSRPPVESVQPSTQLQWLRIPVIG